MPGTNEKTHLLPQKDLLQEDNFSNQSFPGRQPYTADGSVKPSVSAAPISVKPNGNFTRTDNRTSLPAIDIHNYHEHFHRHLQRSRLRSRQRHQSWVSEPSARLFSKGFEDPIESSGSYSEGDEDETEVKKVALQKNLTLFHAIVFVLVNVTGTGIFITPTGVTAGVGSVGATLVTWILCGLYNISLALCYAELGTAFPVAGGDYVYIQKTVGNLLAFMCLIIYVFMGPVAVAVASRTVGEYMLPMLGLQCNTAILVTLAVFLNLVFAVLNTVTIKWTARSLIFFTGIKMVAFAFIIILGLVELGKGNTGNFNNMFQGSITDPGSIALGIIPGFISYSGWDMVCSLVGEMKNPKRDLPLCLVISLSLTIGIYVMMNIAYFTVLTPAEFVASNAVGVLFAERVIPNVVWLIPVFVSLSAMGSLHSEYLGMPRYTYAGAKDKELPQLLSFLSIKYYTPLPAIALQLVLGIFFSAASFFDIQALFLILGINIQLKIGVAMVALLILKFKMNHLERTIRVPTVMVIINLILVVGITVLAVYQDPINNGVGCLIFFLGLPLYYIGKLVKRSETLLGVIDWITVVLQQLLLVVPAED